MSTLYQQWQDLAYDETADRSQLEKFWGTYFQIEKEIYEKLLSNPDEVVKGTVKELAEKFGQEVLTMIGFLDGINESLLIEIDLDTVEEDTVVSLAFDKERLYKNMVAAKADWLYELPQWKEIFSEEELKKFYKEQKEVHRNALQQQLEEKEKALRLARKTAREMEERKARQNTRGEKASIKKGIPRILLGGLKNHAENSSSKLSNVHAEKTDKIQQEITNLKGSLPQTNKLKTDFNASALHIGKILVTAQNINFHYPDSNTNLWTVPLSFQLRSGNRFCIKGDNGSGKTTLLKLITGELTPTGGTIERADFTYIYLDQEYSLIQNEYTVSEQAEAFNLRHLPEHETKTILNRYLFPQDVWNKPCSKLSGGEKMRLAFCCLMIADNTPDLFILDEPTNNLDIESIEIITATIRNYQGTVLAVSHDRDFLKETGIEQEISFFL